MTAETEKEFATYLAEKYEWFGLRFDPGPRYGREWFTPFYDHPEAKCVGFEMPNSSGGFAYLAGVISSLMTDSISANGGAARFGIKTSMYGTIRTTSKVGR